MHILTDRLGGSIRDRETIFPLQRPPAMLLRPLTPSPYLAMVLKALTITTAAREDEAGEVGEFFDGSPKAKRQRSPTSCRRALLCHCHQIASVTASVSRRRRQPRRWKSRASNNSCACRRPPPHRPATNSIIFAATCTDLTFTCIATCTILTYI